MDIRVDLALIQEKGDNLAENISVCVNLHKRSQHTILAICDIDLLGNTLEDGKVVFKVNKDFYDGTRVNIDEAFDLIKKSTIINMVGKKIVGTAIQQGLVHTDAVLDISGIPHAQIVKM